MSDITTTLMIYYGQIEVTVSGEFQREQKEQGPSYASGGEPGYPAHFDDIIAKLGKETIELTESDIERAEEALMDAWKDECDE